MKRQLIFCFSFLLSAAVNAETTPQRITGINIEPHDSAWYAEQSKAWLEEAKRNPLDEFAWKYYFMATSYLSRWENGDNTGIDAAMDVIEENIKDTYTYNYCKYRQLRDKEDVPSDTADSYIRKAMEMLPAKKDFFDYDVLTFFCATKKDCPLLKEIAREYYNSGLCSPYALNYSRNELRSMPSDAIYIGTCDVDLIPKWVLTYGNEEFTGTYSIVQNMLLDSVYLAKVCNDLGIKEKFQFPDYYKYYSPSANVSAFVLHTIQNFLREKTGRPIYFSRLNPVPDAPWNDFLYSEGLVYKYATEDYENDSVYINNMEHVYDLASMLKHAKDDIWNVSNQLAVQYIYTLNTMLYAYAERKDKIHAKWIYNMAKEIAKGTNWTREQKKELLGESELLYQCAMNGDDPATLFEDE